MEDMAPGFRFYPTEEELISFYLQNKLDGTTDDLNRRMDRVIPVVDIYDYNPWDLPQFSVNLCHKDPEQWFFFIPRQESEARGGRPRRLTTTGYWKATGSPGYVYSSNNRPIGVKRTMVFYNGRAPSGRKTEWKMNEYNAISGEASSSSSATATPRLRHEFSLCRIYKKSKCLRSFDRRPPPPAPQAEAAAGAEQRQSSEAAGPSHQNLQMEVGSEDSTSSGDHIHECINPPGNAGESSSGGASRMVVDDETFWRDIDQFWYAKK